MTTFEGVVTLAEDRVPVTVGLDQERVTLVSGDVEIGEWLAAECAITNNGDGTWVIEAEEEILSFVPDEPGRFEQSLNGPAPIPDPAEEAPAHSKTTADSDVLADNETTAETQDLDIAVGPPPKSATLIGFYVLAGATAALALWAIVSLFA